MQFLSIDHEKICSFCPKIAKNANFVKELRENAIFGNDHEKFI